VVRTLEQWLVWLESLHPKEIELGLERISQVASLIYPKFFPANSTQKLPFKVITVGGTNGKGSTIAFLQSILESSNYKTGVYTSPHFLKFNERIQVDSIQIKDDVLCDIFEQIEQSRKNITLTYFEYTTLAALIYFIKEKCEVIILEVGLGGRLDAVNMLDSNVSLVTTVDLDHQDWLGDNIETIAYEKAGIFRKNNIAIYGDYNVPKSLEKYANKLNCQFLKYNIDYSFSQMANDWSITCKESFKKSIGTKSSKLSFPKLKGYLQLKNDTNAIILLPQLELSNIDEKSINKGLENAFILGRYQHLLTDKNATVYTDVAHNPQAAQVLKNTLSMPEFVGKTHAIFSILNDKDIKGVIAKLSGCFDSWSIIQLDSNRSIKNLELKKIIQSVDKNKTVACYNNFSEAYVNLINTKIVSANRTIDKDGVKIVDRIIIFGSFLTVSQAINYFK